MSKTPSMLLLIVMAVVAGCTAENIELSAEEAQLPGKLNFDEQLMTKVRAAGVAIEQLTGTTEDFQSAPVDALALVTEPGRGYEALEEVRALLDGSDYAAYLNENTYGFDNDRIAIVKSTDEYVYLAMVRTDGINYDIEHETVLERYREWDEHYDLALVGAGLDWIEARINVPPASWGDFAEEVYRFCPDVVEQGTGTVKALASEMRRTETLYLWWD